MGDEAKLKQAIDILSSISGNSDNTSGGSGGSGSHRRLSDRRRESGSGSSSIASACSDAAHALRSVREQLQGARKREDNPIDDTRKAAQQEQRVNFAPYSSGSGSKKRKRGRTSLLAQKKTKRHSWSTKFVCLANKNRSKVPCSVDEKEVLVNAGLGERTICIPDVECSSGEFKEILITEFPKLEEAGGFELMRCVPNTRQLEPISATVWRQPKLLKSVVANGRIYIRPIQKNLDLSSIEDADEEVVEKCLTCHKQMPLKELRKHVQSCQFSEKIDDLSSDSDFNVDHSPIYIQSDEGENSERENSLGNRQSSPQATTATDCGLSGCSWNEAGCKSPVVTSPTSEAKEPTCLQDVIKNLSLCVSEDITMVTVRRAYVLLDALRATSRKGFDPHKELKVCFLGEEAADGGGPKREFWRILGKEIQETYFEGKANRLVLRHDAVALVDKKYYQVGQLMAMAVIQGGSGFHYFAPCIYHYLCGAEVSFISVSADDIPDYEVSSVVQKIQNANDDKELQSIAFDAVEMTIESGFSKPVSIMTMDDREELVHIVALHYTLLRSKAELDQLKMGLQSVGVADAMKAYPDLFEGFFTEVGMKCLTADELQKLLGDIRFSPKGSSEREKEEATYMFFLDLLHSCEDGTAPELLRLENVLSFFTGADTLPPLGFKYSPSLVFNSENTFPTASTCALELCLPTKYHQDYTTFCQKAALAFISHGGFGLI